MLTVQCHVIYSHLLCVQRSTHSSIRHLTCITHIPIGPTLIIAIMGFSELDIGCLGKCGFDLIGLASSDWNRLTVLWLTVSHFLCTLICTAGSFNIPILIKCQINRHQLNSVTVRPHTPHLPKSKQGTNSWYWSLVSTWPLRDFYLLGLMVFFLL